MILARSPLSALWLACVLAAACGESTTIPTDVGTADLPCSAINADGSWESVPWPPMPACDWLFFPGGQAYAIAHPLGRTPAIVLGYIAFLPDGLDSTLASGDAFLIEAVSDTSVTIVNGTHQEFFLKLVLR